MIQATTYCPVPVFATGDSGTAILRSLIGMAGGGKLGAGMGRASRPTPTAEKFRLAMASTCRTVWVRPAPADSRRGQPTCDSADFIWVGFELAADDFTVPCQSAWPLGRPIGQARLRTQISETASRILDGLVRLSPRIVETASEECSARALSGAAPAGRLAAAATSGRRGSRRGPVTLALMDGRCAKGWRPHDRL
jgi:hypothetical protein